ncbi:DUF4189 domain-containing protein [Glaesserella sp.]|uniref:DUF4189 domain-containing protein n=1 Tax=Glaesserella sp. TaxID=2094731 RepID=UPI0035A1606B
MFKNYISILKYFFSLNIMLFLSACSTIIKPTDTIYWHGKDVYEFFERKRFPDIHLTCIKNDEISHIFGYQLSLYDLQTYEVGRNATTIFMTTDKVYTGETTWTYVFTDANEKITSIREATGFGDIEKEYKCGEYREEILASDDALSKRKVKPRIWSAIYFSASSNLIWGNDDPYKNVEDAKKDALAQCQKEGKTDCQFLLAFSNSCFGIARGEKNGTPFDTMGFHITSNDASEAAIKECQDKKQGTNCQSVNTVCTVPCDILSDNSCMYDPPQAIYPAVKGGEPFIIPIEGLTIEAEKK